MKTLIQYINEAIVKIKLPHTFDIYNSGAKNVNHKITKYNIYKIFFNIDGDAVNFIDTYSEFIKLPLAPNDITYIEQPTKSNTNNWESVPEVNEYTYAGAYYSDKSVEYNYDRYNSDWDRWLNSLRPYMSGKISVTIKEDKERSKTGHKQLIIIVNNDKFNKDRDDKIKELKNPDNLKRYAEDAKRRENEINQKEVDRKKAQNEHDKWWNSLSDSEKECWIRGYGQGKYMGD